MVGRFYLSETARARLAAEAQRMRRQLAERRVAAILERNVKGAQS